jgi:hypothetical protein
MDEDLANACFELARTAKWTQRPIDSAEITALAERFRTIAASRVCPELNIDVPLLTRAVRYIGQAHGMPMGDDTAWFSHMLHALIEVARPNSCLEESGKDFLEDMIEGITETLRETAE